MALDPASVDWKRALRASYLLRQTFRYEYPSPIRDLNHRLIVIPPERFGDQRRLRYELSVSPEGVQFENQHDRFGNLVAYVLVSEVSGAIEFTAEVAVDRNASEQNRLLEGPPADDYLLQPSRLTGADDHMRREAERLTLLAKWGVPLADRINDWVYQSMTYRHDVTGINTTAAEALALGAGVCQDYAHLMLAMCRACGLPSRYVSGHLLGQGGTHAWVEVVLPADDGSGEAIAWPFDPTHACRGGLDYITIAVGADYSDVAPTSGTYMSTARGSLTTSKHVTLTDFE